jgi:hypothetical protein
VIADQQHVDDVNISAKIAPKIVETIRRMGGRGGEQFGTALWPSVPLVVDESRAGACL